MISLDSFYHSLSSTILFLSSFCCLIILSFLTSPSQSAFEFQKGRRWYFAGSFSKLTNEYNEEINVGNVAFLDSNGEFFPLGKNGTNGPVQVLHVDMCLNVYIGGEFTHVDGIETGPIAKYSYWNREWESVVGNGIQFAELSTGTLDAAPNQQGVVHDIVTNCVHFPICKCDVFFGGQFRFNDSKGAEAVSLAMYDASGDSTLSLSPTEAPWDANRTEVYSLHKKNLGVTVATKYLWVGGKNLSSSSSNENIHFGRINLDDFSWNAYSEVNGLVRSFEYIPATVGFTDRLYVAGDFDFVSDNAHCKYICEFDHASQKWTQVTDQVEGPIYSLQRNEHALYIAGNFSYGVGILDGDKVQLLDDKHTEKIGENQLIHTLDVCSRLDLACKGGSAAMSGEDGFLRFYNTKKAVFEKFGGIVDGDVNAIVSSFQVRSGACSERRNISFVLCVVMIGLAIVGVGL